MFKFFQNVFAADRFLSLLEQFLLFSGLAWNIAIERLINLKQTIVNFTLKSSFLSFHKFVDDFILLMNRIYCVIPLKGTGVLCEVWIESEVIFFQVEFSWFDLLEIVVTKSWLLYMEGLLIVLGDESFDGFWLFIAFFGSESWEHWWIIID